MIKPTLITWILVIFGALFVFLPSLSLPPARAGLSWITHCLGGAACRVTGGSDALHVGQNARGTLPSEDVPHLNGCQPSLRA